MPLAVFTPSFSGFLLLDLKTRLALLGSVQFLFYNHHWAYQEGI